MAKTAFALLFLAGIALAGEVVLHSPTAAVSSYYEAMNEGDLDALEETMLRDSYDMDVQVYALSLAFEDRNFDRILKPYPHSEEAREIVKKEVAKKLRNRPKRAISSLREVTIGVDRVIVQFKEEGKAKQLYLSQHGRSWKIDYKAGRKTN